MKDRGAGMVLGKTYDFGPELRYISDPKYVFRSKPKYIDMAHFLYVGNNTRFHGFGIEAFQLFSGNSSAFKRQDLYSNKLGRQFFNQYGSLIESNPRNISEYIYKFLLDRHPLNNTNYIPW